MSDLKTVLVTRFSAMGDVVLVVPVLRGVLFDHPDIQIVLVTRKMFFPFFANIDRLILHEFDPNQKHKGFLGLIKLAKEINTNYKIYTFVDLHNVLRTKILSFLIRKNNFAKINKGRKEKNEITRPQNKIRKVLKHTTERYAEVFTNAGYPCRITAGDWLKPENATAKAQTIIDTIKKDKLSFASIGIAPFAKHKQKMWPIDKMRKLIQMLSETQKCKIYLFGAGGAEASLMQLIAKTHPNVINLAGELNFSDEINVIKELKLMVTMDSGNMHIAALSGIKVVSIWGATHPDIGFAPLGDNQSSLIQTDVQTVTCRPCSVFGDTPCFRGDFICMNSIQEQQVFKEICLHLGVVLKESVTEVKL